MWALMTGLFGTVFMACSVFAVTAETSLILLSALLAVPAFAGWIGAYFVYRAVLHRKIEETAPKIEEKYEELYTICEKGNRLLI